MNFYKLAGPDTPLGKFLMTARAESQLLGIRLGGGGPWVADFVRTARMLVPRYTMVSAERLKKLYELGAELGRSKNKGAVVECGVWNGGSSAIVAAGLESAGDRDRPFWLFDSFEGLPEPTEKDEDKVRDNYFPGWCTGGVERVREAHGLVGHMLESTTIVPGWFDQTLAKHADAIGPIALLHADADWYDSMTTVLTVCYPQVISGGIVVIDDYGAWSGCRKAVHDFFGDEEKFAALNFQPIDNNAVWFYKP